MTILPVGFLFYDGTKYIIKSEIDITGPAGPPGPQGPAGVAAGPASGDLGGNFPNPLVVKLQGRSISSSAPSDGQILTWVASNNDWEPQPAPTGFTAGGDLSGTATNQNVINVHGASVPIAGALTTGNVLQVTGASTLSYGAVNLAGGNDFVTGTLPAGNQAAQTMGGDVTGTTAANTVVTLTGSGGIVNFPITNILRSTGGSNVGDIITTSAGSIQFGNQSSATNVGLYFVNSVSIFSSAAAAQLSLLATGAGAYVKTSSETVRLLKADNSTEMFRFDTVTGFLSIDSGSGTFPAFGDIRSKDSRNILAANYSSTDYGLVGFNGGILYLGSKYDNTNPVSGMQLNAISNVSMVFSGTTHWYWTSSDYTMQAYKNDAAPTIKQRDLTTNSGTGNTFTIQAQNETGTTSVGGNLVLTSGTGTSTHGSTILQVGGTAKLTLAPTSSILTSTAQTQVNSGSMKLQLDGTSGTAGLYSTTNIGFASTTGASTDAFNIVINDTGATQLNFSAGVTPTIKQNDLTTNSGTGATLTIQAQNETGTTSVGGALVLASGTGTSTHGLIQIKPGSVATVNFSPSGGTALAGTGTMRTAKDFSIKSRNSGDTGDFNLISIDGANNIAVGATTTVSVTQILAATEVDILSNSVIAIETPGNMYLDAIAHHIRGSTHVEFASFTETGDIFIIGQSTNAQVRLMPWTSAPTTYGSLYLLPGATATGAGTYTLIGNGTDTYVNIPNASGHLYLLATNTTTIVDLTTSTADFYVPIRLAATGTYPSFGDIRSKNTRDIIAGEANAGTSYGILSWDTANVIVGSRTTLASASAAASVTLSANTAVGIFGAIAGLTYWYWTPADYTMQMYLVGAAPTIKQRQQTSDTATFDFTWQGQSAFTGSTGTNRNGASLILKPGAKDTGGLDGAVKIGQTGYATIGTATGVSILLPYDSEIRFRDVAGTGNIGGIYMVGNVLYLGSYSTGAAFPNSVYTYSTGQIHWNSGGADLYYNGNDLVWDQGFTHTIKQEIRSSDAATFSFTIKGQDAFVGATGTNRNAGDLLLRGGARDGTGLKGGVKIQMNNTTETMFEAVSVVDGYRITALNRGANLTSTQMPLDTGDLVTYIGNANIIPQVAPVSGGILYSNAGALEWYSPGGTQTTVAPNDPHCPKCGRDWVLSARNNRQGWRGALCLFCLGTSLAKLGVDVSEFSFDQDAQ